MVVLTHVTEHPITFCGRTVKSLSPPDMFKTMERRNISDC